MKWKHLLVQAAMVIVVVAIVNRSGTLAALTNSTPKTATSLP